VTSKKPDFQHVKGKPELVRDTKSGAILNTKATPPGSAAKRRQEKDLKIETMQKDMDVLKSELSELKNLIKQSLLNK
tara:strand:- start:111 stop:341 length:231 start_codon:yes stop_codon:yes gene_type:complete